MKMLDGWLRTQDDTEKMPHTLRNDDCLSTSFSEHILIYAGKIRNQYIPSCVHVCICKSDVFYPWSLCIFIGRECGLNIYFLLQKDEIQHPLPSVNIGSYKSKNTGGGRGVVVLIMCSSSPLVVCSNRNLSVERFFPGWSNDTNTRTAIYNE